MLPVLSVLAFAGLAADGLEKPTAVLAAGKPINVEVGHAAPLVHDMDADGVPDLLVGQFGGGKLRYYRNVGTQDKPAFSNFTYVKAGGVDATVSYG